VYCNDDSGSQHDGFTRGAVAFGHTGKRISVLQDKIEELQTTVRVKDETMKAQLAEIAGLSEKLQQLQDFERKVRYLASSRSCWLDP
jgi:hypothetical protein